MLMLQHFWSRPHTLATGDSVTNVRINSLVHNARTQQWTNSTNTGGQVETAGLHQQCLYSEGISCAVVTVDLLRLSICFQDSSLCACEVMFMQLFWTGTLYFFFIHSSNRPIPKFKSYFKLLTTSASHYKQYTVKFTGKNDSYVCHSVVVKNIGNIVRY